MFRKSRVCWAAAITLIGSLIILALIGWVLVTIPSRTGNAAPRSGYGLLQVSTLESVSSPDGVDVIFLHGLGSHPDTAWCATPALDHVTANQTEKERLACWVADFLPEDMPDEIRSNIRLFTYNYDTYYKKDVVHTTIENAAQNLLSQLNSIRQSEVVRMIPRPVSPLCDFLTRFQERSRYLIFLAHSHGGLVLKKALVSAARSDYFTHIVQSTTGIMFLGTPHFGADSIMTTLGIVEAWFYSPVNSNPAILWPTIDSNYLLDLHAAFGAVAGHSRVYNFFEGRKMTMSLGPISIGRWVVHKKSAIYHAPNVVNNIELSLNHRRLNKFGSKDVNYVAIRNSLVESIYKSLEIRRRNTIFLVPHFTVTTYTNRPRISQSIEAKMRVTHENGIVPHALVLHGLGGVGKSQLALKFIESNRFNYDSIFWVDAMTNITAILSFERLALGLGLSVQRSVVSDASLEHTPFIQQVLGWLTDRDKLGYRWLVVFDNYDEDTWEMDRILPRGSYGSILITSQNARLGKLLFRGRCEEEEIGEMEPSEAASLVLRNLNLAPKAVDNTISEYSVTLALHLGYLAFPINLIGAYIAIEGGDSAVVLKTLVEELHTCEPTNEHFGSTVKKKAVQGAFDRLFARLATEYESLHLQEFLTFLASFQDPVQVELFRLASLVPERHPPYFPHWLSSMLKSPTKAFPTPRFKETLGVLERYHLIQVTGGQWPAITMHSLIRWHIWASHRAAVEIDQLRQDFMISVLYQYTTGVADPAYESLLLYHAPFLLPWGDSPENFHLMALRQRYTYRDHDLILHFYTMGPFTNSSSNETDGLVSFLISSLDRHARDIFCLRAIELIRNWIQLNPNYAAFIVFSVAHLLNATGTDWQPVEDFLGALTLQDGGVDFALEISNRIKAYYNYRAPSILESQLIIKGRQLLGSGHPTTLKAADALAHTCIMAKKMDWAENFSNMAAQYALQEYGAFHELSIRYRCHHGLVLLAQKKWSEAEALFTELALLADGVLDAVDTLSVSIRFNLAMLREMQGEDDGDLGWIAVDAVMDGHVTSYGLRNDTAVLIAKAKVHLAKFSQHAGRLEEAVQHAKEASELAKLHFPSTPLATSIHYNLAKHLCRLRYFRGVFDNECEDALLRVLVRGVGAKRVHAADLTTASSILVLLYFKERQEDSPEVSIDLSDLHGYRELLKVIFSELGLKTTDTAEIQLKDMELAKIGNDEISLDDGLKRGDRFAHCEVADRTIVQFASVQFDRRLDTSGSIQFLQEGIDQPALCFAS